MSIGDRIEDKSEELKGVAKEKIGSATGDRDLEAEGKADKVMGKAGQAVEDLKDAGRRMTK